MKPANDDGPTGHAAGPEPSDRKDALRPRPRRFFKTATVQPTGSGFAILLDGRSVRTPSKSILVVPAAVLADEIAMEWNAQGDEIDIEAMAMTRLANTALDRVAGREEEICSEIAAYGANDLLCYRAEGPGGLRRMQADAWDDVLEWAAEEFGARLATTVGVMPIEQDAGTRHGLGAALQGLEPFVLTGLHNLTTLSGSMLLALAVLRGRLTAEGAWDRAHVDEAWQREQWGADALAEKRLAYRRGEFLAGSRFISLARTR